MGYYGDKIREMGIGDFIAEFGDVLIEDIISEFNGLDEGKNGVGQIQKHSVIGLPQSKK